MQIISNKDPEIEKYKEKIAQYVQTYESMGLEYWLFVPESIPVAIFFSGKEPVNLISPPGTPMGMIKILDYIHAMEYIDEIAVNSLKFGKESNAKYILVSNVPQDQNELVSTFRNHNFVEHASWYIMRRSLDNILAPEGTLILKKVKKEETREFLQFAEHCTSGSYEDESMLYLAEIPDLLLNFWYDMQQLYYVYLDEKVIGILNLTLSSENNLNNIGVAPEYRSNGYGREIMKYALTKLKEQGKEEARLRVHMKNTRAKKLYDSLGFETIEQQINIIRWIE